MRRLPLLWKTVRDYRGVTAWIAFVAAVIAVVDIAIYPSYHNALKQFQTPDALKGFVGEAGSLSSPAGFISAEFFSWIPLLLITLAIVGITGEMGGEEGEGTLEFLLAQPIRRSRCLAEKAGGIALLIALTTLTATIALVASAWVSGFEISNLRLAEATLNMLPLTFFYLAIAVTASAMLPSRSTAALIATGTVVAGYFVNAIGASVASFNWLQKLSPFYWGDSSHVLVHGFDWWRVVALLAVAGALFAVALFAFERRDVGSAAEPQFSLWRRNHGAERPGTRKDSPTG